LIDGTANFLCTPPLKDVKRSDKTQFAATPKMDPLTVHVRKAGL
jgi:hypothetical protein